MSDSQNNARKLLFSILFSALLLPFLYDRFINKCWKNFLLFTALWSVKRQRICFNFREKFELPGILNESAKRREIEGLWRQTHVFVGMLLSLSKKLLSCSDRAFIVCKCLVQVVMLLNKLSLQVLYFHTSFLEIQEKFENVRASFVCQRLHNISTQTLSNSGESQSSFNTFSVFVMRYRLRVAKFGWHFREICMLRWNQTEKLKRRFK